MCTTCSECVADMYVGVKTHLCNIHTRPCTSAHNTCKVHVTLTAKKCTYIYTHIHMYTHTYAHENTCACVTLSTRWSTDTKTHNLWTNMHTHTHAHVYERIDVQIHTHMHIYTHIHVRTHTHQWAVEDNVRSGILDRASVGEWNIDSTRENYRHCVPESVHHQWHHLSTPQRRQHQPNFVSKTSSTAQ